MINYFSDTHCLPKVDSIKDLGIIFTFSFSFLSHIQSMIIKTQTLGSVVRNIYDFNNILSLKVLYFALIRSSLEYVETISVMLD
jgi:hypothetical protein